MFYEIKNLDGHSILRNMQLKLAVLTDFLNDMWNHVVMRNFLVDLLDIDYI